MKKILCLMLALMMAMSFSAFAEDGTFTGVGEGGKAGNVSVEVTVEGGAIKDINILENEETEGLGDVAMEDLKQQMLTGSTVDVEAVTGATLSSTAFIAAVKDALSQAGIDPESLVATGETAEAAELEDAYDCDVLVIGAGGAGMATLCCPAAR